MVSRFDLISPGFFSLSPSRSPPFSDIVYKVSNNATASSPVRQSPHFHTSFPLVLSYIIAPTSGVHAHNTFGGARRGAYYAYTALSDTFALTMRASLPPAPSCCDPNIAQYNLDNLWMTPPRVARSAAQQKWRMMTFAALETSLLVVFINSRCLLRRRYRKCLKVDLVMVEAVRTGRMVVEGAGEQMVALRISMSCCP